MVLTLKLVVLLCLSAGLFLEADAKCRKKGNCCKRCPDGWTRHGDRCLKFHNEPKTWCKAESHCVEQGGNLVAVHSKADADIIRKMVKRITGARTKTWLGGYDRVEEGCWHNSDGSKFDFKDWGKNEPNNYGGDEGCQQMHNEEGQPVNDAPCNVMSAYMCAMDVDDEVQT
ncbi:galactose-specific lectin nattectin-like [Cheilinus undulatus]|uniref:galactose-specific lectin nattectin-like n=1 Tax=Cheilinus undulatus TaxID=241271 RepID=UPI001BD21B3A|nr:galactose-specific lectin nattectin-like [Cheilinus undulatus]